MAEAKFGVIGGTGLYQIEGLTDVQDIKVKTPFGDPSDAIAIGKLEGVEVAFLPRHGRGHHLSPTEVPSRANIYALKSLGVERIIAVAAVGSLRHGKSNLHFCGRSGEFTLSQHKVVNALLASLAGGRFAPYYGIGSAYLLGAGVYGYGCRGADPA